MSTRRNFRNRSTWVLACLLASGCGGRSKETAETVPNQVEPKASTTKTFTLKGVVREVDAKQKAVTIAHEAMPGFMGAMTMPFTLVKAESLEDVQPGDEVEAPIVVEYEGARVKSYRLGDLIVTNPAPLTFSLSVGKNGATLQPKAAVLQAGATVPDFSMTTQNGASLKLSDLKGKVVVLTFIYTRCPLPDFCPATDRAFGALAKQLGDVKGRADRVRLVSLSFDPEHDTPEVLRKHASVQGAVPPLWTYAVASHDELRKVAGPLGLTYGPMKDEIVHDLSTAVIDTQGRLVVLKRGKAGKDWTAADLAKEVIGQLRVSGQ